MIKTAFKLLFYDHFCQKTTTFVEIGIFFTNHGIIYHE